MRDVQHFREISRVQLISYKSSECCIWKCLLFVLFSPCHFQWCVIHSRLGTMKQCITSPQRLYNKPNRRNSTPCPIFDKINKLSTQYWGGKKRMVTFSRGPDAGGDWPERKPWMNFVLSTLLIFLMTFPLICRFPDVCFPPDTSHSLPISACQLNAI